MIIRPSLTPDAPLADQINEMVERVRLSGITHALPIEVHLGMVETRPWHEAPPTGVLV